MELPEFIFVHILKTGGTTFKWAILNPFYGKNCVYDDTFKIKDAEKKRKLGMAKKSILDFSLTNFPPNYKLSKTIYGHFRIEKYEHLNRPFVTFLRDPVERLISHYFYHKHLYNNINIKEFAEIYPNHMTYILGSDLSKLEFIGILERYDYSIAKFVQHFNLQHPNYIIQKRIGKYDKGLFISRSDREYIKELNKEDYKLYNEVVGRYIRREI